MATVTDVEVANASFPNVRQDLNDILEAITTNFSADDEPTTTYPNQWWYETDTNQLYIRNEADDAWIHVLTLDQTTDTVSSVEGVSSDKIEEGNSSVEVVDTGTGFIQINVDGAEVGRFDASGDLLIGKTSSAFGTEGVEVQSDRLWVTRDGGGAVDLNRLTSDGAVAQVYKDGTSVGAIGVNGGDLVVHGTASSHSGFRFIDNGILPTNNAGGDVDNSVDLGSTSKRFKDLYLSGGAYIGGTSAANYFDDYEEGTWTPSYEPITGSFTTITYKAVTEGSYTKIGQKVTLVGTVDLDALTVGSASNGLDVAGLPFTPIDSTSSYSGSISQQTGWSTAPTQLFVRDDGKIGLGYMSASGTGSYSVIGVSDMSDGSRNRMRFTITYFTDS